MAKYLEVECQKILGGVTKILGVAWQNILGVKMALFWDVVAKFDGGGGEMRWQKCKGNGVVKRILGVEWQKIWGVGGKFLAGGGWQIFGRG